MPQPHTYPTQAGVPRRRQHQEHGFALVIALSLMAFVLLLLLSIIALTKIESELSSTAMKQMRAEQNALLALDVAIGQLQKYVGPDQRTTARADLINGAGSINSHWIGAFGSAVEADYDLSPENIPQDLTDTTLISSKGSPARLLNWLVSGSESDFSPEVNVGDKGNILSTPSVSATPTGTVTGLSETTTATDTTLTITDASGTTHPARLLVGPNSVNSALDSSSTPVDYVVAPTVDIESSGSTSNRYAWWISDDGMKARVNLPQAGTDSSLSPTEQLEQQRNAFSNSERAAIELMATNNDDWSESSPSSGQLIDTLYTPDQSLSSIISSAHTALISSDTDAMAAALKYRFHDLTPHSRSVLSDTYAGGLKRDLSILLDGSYSPAPSDPTYDTNTLWPRHSGATGGFSEDYGMPTWRHLRSYYQTRVPSSGALDPILPAHDKSDRIPINSNGVEDHVGLAPILTYYSMGFSMGISKPSGNYEAEAGDNIFLKLYPLVVIWNPYNFTIKASSYEVGCYPTHNVNVKVQKATGTDGAMIDASQQLDFSRLGDSQNQQMFIRFRLDCPDIPPGQSLIFSLPDSASGESYTQKNILKNQGPNKYSYVTVPFKQAGSGTQPQLLIEAGEEDVAYQLIATSGSSLTSSGGWNMYLGEPVEADNVFFASWTLKEASTGPNHDRLKNPSSSAPTGDKFNRRWYNTHQSIDWTDSQADQILQLADPLEYDSLDEPAYVALGHALFSGAGLTARFNEDQHMFTTRWIAQGNMRATRTGRTMRDQNFNVLYIATSGMTAQNVKWQKFNAASSAPERISAGSGFDSIDGNSAVDAMLFEFPYEDQDLFSIGQLQHANLSFFGSYPSYPIGNSLADYHLHNKNPEITGHQLTRIDEITTDNNYALRRDMNAYYDISYLLNRTLWDQYYFSTVPATGSVPDTLPNPRYQRHSNTADLQDPDQSASALLMAGGFNINSTSEQAWRAVLGGGNQLDYIPQNADLNTNPELNAAFPRFSRPYGDNDPNDPWKGYRTLDENQIAQLARNIVTEIRNRGPFVSVADFVNRRLYDNPNTNDDDPLATDSSWEHENFKGPLQAAIDRTETGNFAANDASNTFWQEDELATGDGIRHNQNSQYSKAYDKALLEGADVPSSPVSNRSAFAPKYITQADILAKIGAGLTARSDTFTIRTYGETVNPATQAIEGQAWCEAVVQRLPDYVDDSLEAYQTPANGSINQSLGRKFKIISLQWLSASDI
ncbi:hypothetical protein SH580_17430 [Coraliomargarita algicola]|uniref:Tfp pilus assembly protein PilX n=1 Tax=Coraliomargarita algicola TaxID=3092156 RepID=A0ABZ0RGP6_9BACT|nr:hypothetical protein [Coraliomargarita sp. J2-16]WPJ95207.1 hypothetical protein SH580_17430 [Coraliomargarita sp. J2-16]